MGNLIYASFDVLRVTQDYLVNQHLLTYLGLRDNRHIPPIPVTQDMVLDQKYTVLDGHHFLASMRQKNQSEVPIWICDSERDFITPDSGWDKKLVQNRNEQIKRRFRSAPFYVPIIDSNEIFNIDDLILHGII